MAFTSKVNGLDIPISGDMGRAASFFKTEHSATIIDDGKANVNLKDPAQVESEVKRLTAQIESLQQAATKPTAKKSKTVAAVVETDLA